MEPSTCVHQTWSHSLHQQDCQSKTVHDDINYLPSAFVLLQDSTVITILRKIIEVSWCSLKATKLDELTHTLKQQNPSGVLQVLFTEYCKTTWCMGFLTHVGVAKHLIRLKVFKWHSQVEVLGQDLARNARNANIWHVAKVPRFTKKLKETSRTWARTCTRTSTWAVPQPDSDCLEFAFNWNQFKFWYCWNNSNGSTTETVTPIPKVCL